ncbi:unnamed protein product [Phytomonas sp. Hart1]|nr:unnamed protein product [Phytomonas sp. Hart1]|eukprot:CCW69693.1 unnamed protein product [Phytomonas sp. isolate Hart1]
MASVDDSDVLIALHSRVRDYLAGRISDLPARTLEDMRSYFSWFKLTLQEKDSHIDALESELQGLRAAVNPKRASRSSSLLSENNSFTAGAGSIRDSLSSTMSKPPLSPSPTFVFPLAPPPRGGSSKKAVKFVFKSPRRGKSRSNTTTTTTHNSNEISKYTPSRVDPTCGISYGEAPLISTPPIQTSPTKPNENDEPYHPKDENNDLFSPKDVQGRPQSGRTRGVSSFFPPPTLRYDASAWGQPRFHPPAPPSAFGGLRKVDGEKERGFQAERTKRWDLLEIGRIHLIQPPQRRPFLYQDHLGCSRQRNPTANMRRNSGGEGMGGGYTNHCYTNCNREEEGMMNVAAVECARLRRIFARRQEILLNNHPNSDNLRRWCTVNGDKTFWKTKMRGEG